MLAVALALAPAATASKWPLRAPHASGVPASFDCAMRKAAYDYGKMRIPRMGKFESLYYALDLNDPDCKAELSGPEPTRAKGPSVPADAIYVAVDGDDDAVGTLSAPLRSMQAAADLAASRSSGSQTVVLRGGTHYLTETLTLTPKHSGLSFVAHPGEDPVVSGGTQLKDLEWTAYNVTPGQTGWVVEQGQNAVYGGKPDNKTYQVYGKTDNAQECQDACGADPNCNIFTWHDDKQGSYANECWFRLDGQWNPTAEAGHVSGYNASAIPSQASKNIWMAKLNGQVPDVPGLQLNGARATRARFPNIPGGIEVSCGYDCMISSGDAEWTPPQFNKFGPVDYYNDNISSHNRPNGGWFEHYNIGINGLCSVYDPPVSYWCSEHPSGGGAFAFRTPSGVTPKEGALPNLPYKDVSEAVFFVWRPARWANWMFKIGKYDEKTSNFTFGEGGNQGARGNDKGGDWFVENVMEELDFPGEFFWDKKDDVLYLNYNGTGAPPKDLEVVVPQLRTLVNLTGTQWNPVKDIKHSGITYKATRYTYMDPHGVPSAGDWALDRVGAVFLQGTEDITFDGCTFERLDGNGVMVSGYNRRATVTNSDFSFIGGNAVAAWGYTNETETDPGRPGIKLANWPKAGVDGTDGEHPRFTTVTNCTAREIGLYEKQSSFFVQAKTSESMVSGNVFFNGPRAGINANDGFGGGDEISYNLVFSTCRESGDHGPFNSWDRQPFLTTVRNGTASMLMQWREIHHNFFIDNYSPQEDVDNDDGSAYYKTHDNFLVYGGRGMKNDFGGHDNHHYNNIYAYTGQVTGLCGQQPGHEDYVYNNKAVITGSDFGGLTCDGDAKTVVYGNEYYTSSGKISECKMDLADWQKKGNDKGSTVSSIPADDVIIGWAKETLGF